MNKKFFTLAAALMMGSAFMVNAQTTQLDAGTKFDGKVYYYLGDANNLIGASAEEADAEAAADKILQCLLLPAEKM